MNITLSQKNYDVTSPSICAMRVRTPGPFRDGLDRYGITIVNAIAALRIFLNFIFISRIFEYYFTAHLIF